ncbi:hypothetical protein V1477_017193 [Vespula maculifrons]|uniref:Uncharacterized protein n=1 Tax=Vespula maculifrons TaxID=7453 RepID=A0ABD2B5A9_VESMC
MEMIWIKIISAFFKLTKGLIKFQLQRVKRELFEQTVITLIEREQPLESTRESVSREDRSPYAP